MDLRERLVRQYLYHYGTPGCIPTRMAELAKGVVAVETKEWCDVVFCTDVWTELVSWDDHPLHAGKRPTKPPQKKIEVLSGMLGIPRRTTIEQMASYAKEKIRAKTDAVWHNSPIEFTLVPL